MEGPRRSAYSGRVLACPQIAAPQGWRPKSMSSVPTPTSQIPVSPTAALPVVSYGRPLAALGPYYLAKGRGHIPQVRATEDTSGARRGAMDAAVDVDVHAHK
jgi:hypothetical protein